MFNIMPPKFSLVVGTLGRTGELRRFLDSVVAQSYRHFEVVIVDQNPDDRVEKLLLEYKDRCPIVHLRAEPGLSKARNFGLRACSGDLVAFPDDDCWYPPGLLEVVARYFVDHPQWDGLTGRCVDEYGDDAGPKFDRQHGAVDRYNVWWRGISTSLFLRRGVVEKVGDFDETLGLGSGTPFGSGEETDYLIRVLQNDFTLQYLPAVFVHHPQMEAEITPKMLTRTYSYGAGMGRVLKKHQYPVWFKIRSLIRPLFGALFALARFKLMKARLYWNRCRGRGRGLLSPQSNT